MRPQLFDSSSLGVSAIFHQLDHFVDAAANPVEEPSLHLMEVNLEHIRGGFIQRDGHEVLDVGNVVVPYKFSDPPV